MHRDDEDGDVRVVAVDPFDEVEPTPPLQRQVGDEEPGREGLDEVERLGLGGRLGTHVEVGLGVEDLAEPAPHDRVVVHEHDLGDIAGHTALRIWTEPVARVA